MAIFPGTAGNDTYPGTTADDTINGLGGDDELRGDAGNDTIDGGDGFDILYGDAGNDTIYGRSGNDRIQGGLGQDYLDGGAGADIADYTTFNGNGIYDLGLGTANLGVFTEVMLNFEKILTGGGNDLITGTSGNNALNGGAGNDTIYGGAGDDYIAGGAGDDTIQGGLGQDYLEGGAGDFDTVDYTTFNGFATYDLSLGTANLGVFTETMSGFENIKIGNGGSFTYGTNRDNTIFGGAGADYIFADAGYDMIYGGAGNDSIYGGVGNDSIQGGLGEDYLDGGDGIDQVDYTTFNGNATYDLRLGTANLGVFTETMLSFENIYTGAGNDTIYGVAGAENPGFFRLGNIISAGDGNDTIYGAAGGDSIYGGAGNDTIDGGAGNDSIQGGLGQDNLNGGGGNDTVDYTTFNGGGTFDIQYGVANLGVFTEQIFNFESITTGSGNDTIYGPDGESDGFSNTLSGGAGNDTIYGGNGSNTIYGGDGSDSLFGGNSFDMIYGGDGNDTIDGGAGKDYIQGGAGQDTLDGGDGVDEVDYTTFNGDAVYNLATGSANLIGVFTETMLNFESIYAGGGSDLILGTTGTNKIYAGAGDDRIYGNAGDDFLSGQDGNDDIQGDAGNDFLSGDAGNDTFYFGGAAISTTNTVNSSLGIDTITDFTQGSDKIVLSQSAFTNITAGGGLNFATVANDADVSAISTTATIVYSRGTRTVFYNENGNAAGLGAGGGFAVVNGLAAGVDIQASDFTLAA